MSREEYRRMRITTAMALALAVTMTTGAHADKHDKTSKGALKEHADPAKDERVQQKNVAKLKVDAAADRKAGNRVAAWAAEGDAKHARKLVDKDKKLEGKKPRQ